MRAIKWAVIIIALVMAGLFIWGYAPDRTQEELRAAYAPSPSQFVELPNGQTLHIRDTGPRDAPVLLLLHGSGASLHTWEGWAAALQDRYRVIRYDHPGHGLTGPHILDDYTGKAYSDTAAALMAQLSIKRYTVAGNSMGGWIAWRHALDHADNVRGLVLVDASGAPRDENAKVPIGFRLAQMPWLRPIISSFTPRSVIKSTLIDSVADPAHITEDMVDLYWNLLRHPGNRDATAKRFATARESVSAETIAKIAVPTLILWGAKDTLIPVASAQWFDDHIPESDTIIYDDLGHLPMDEAPTRTATDLANWLTEKGLDQVNDRSEPGGFLDGAPRERSIF